eukprot:g19260.t1
MHTLAIFVGNLSLWIISLVVLILRFADFICGCCSIMRNPVPSRAGFLCDIFKNLVITFLQGIAALVQFILGITCLAAEETCIWTIVLCLWCVAGSSPVPGWCDKWVPERAKREARKHRTRLAGCGAQPLEEGFAAPHNLMKDDEIYGRQLFVLLGNSSDVRHAAECAALEVLDDQQVSTICLGTGEYLFVEARPGRAEAEEYLSWPKMPADAVATAMSSGLPASLGEGRQEGSAALSALAECRRQREQQEQLLLKAQEELQKAARLAKVAGGLVRE